MLGPDNESGSVSPLPSPWKSLCEIRMLVHDNLVEFTYKTSRPGVLFLGKVHIFDSCL